MIERVAIVDAMSTPFAKRATAFAELGVLDLAAHVVRALVDRSRLERDDVGLVVFGHVVPSMSIVKLAQARILRAPARAASSSSVRAGLSRGTKKATVRRR